MPLISTAAQCRALDATTIDGWGVPGVALMEIASRAVAETVRDHHREAARRGVVVLCGGGNNGGDGFGAARWLHLWGFPVRTLALSERSTGDAAAMRNACDALRIPAVDTLPDDMGLAVDALFGTGLSRPLEGRAAALLDTLNRRATPVVAVDIPSGLHADTGALLGPVPAATHTVTFGRLKPAFFTPNGARAGTVRVVDIGIPRRGRAVGELGEASFLATLWPTRSPQDHKGSHGHLAVVAGSVEMAGAAVLTCEGAVRAGVGLVTLFVAPEALPRLGALSPTVMVRPLPAAEALGQVQSFDAVAIGPGLGGGRPLPDAVRRAIAERMASSQPVVLDADALLPELARAPAPRCIRTPHPGELGRLLGCSSAAIQADRFGKVQALPGVTLLKGRFTLIHDGAGFVHVNPTNAAVLATAGSGDVLTGVIGALLARGLEPVDAGRIGAWIHGRAGERLERDGPEGHTAFDIAGAIPGAIRDLLDAAP